MHEEVKNANAHDDGGQRVRVNVDNQIPDTSWTRYQLQISSNL
jgi:hypothetical protein